MLIGVDAHAVVYQVLDEILASSGVPAGARGAMFAVVDDLRAGIGEGEGLRRAERISIEIHKLEWALRRRDSSAAHVAREQLKAMSAEWINMRICSRH